MSSIWCVAFSATTSGACGFGFSCAVDAMLVDGSSRVFGPSNKCVTDTDMTSNFRDRKANKSETPSVPEHPISFFALDLCDLGSLARLATLIRYQRGALFGRFRIRQENATYYGEVGKHKQENRRTLITMMERDAQFSKARGPSAAEGSSSFFWFQPVCLVLYSATVLKAPPTCCLFLLTLVGRSYFLAAREGRKANEDDSCRTELPLGACASCWAWLAERAHPIPVMLLQPCFNSTSNTR